MKVSSDFQGFSNLVENLAVTVENVGKKSRFTSSILIRALLKKLPEYLRLQWGQHMVLFRSDDVDSGLGQQQNDVISKGEIGNEARPTERPTEVKICERNKN
jgi:hypothetical protein